MGLVPLEGWWFMANLMLCKLAAPTIHLYRKQRERGGSLFIVSLLSLGRVRIMKPCPLCSRLCAKAWNWEVEHKWSVGNCSKWNFTGGEPWKQGEETPRIHQPSTPHSGKWTQSATLSWNNLLYGKFIISATAASHRMDVQLNTRCKLEPMPPLHDREPAVQ